MSMAGAFSGGIERPTGRRPPDRPRMEDSGLVWKAPAGGSHNYFRRPDGFTRPRPAMTRDKLLLLFTAIMLFALAGGFDLLLEATP